MSDEAAVRSNSTSPAGGASAGMLLRQAREATGLHVAALAVAIKVPVKKLEALEADRFDELPDAVFVRALASSICRTLKVDAAPILAKLPQSVVPRLEANEGGVRMPHAGPGLFSGKSAAAMLSRPATLAVVVLLLAALAVVFIPEARDSVGMGEMVKSASAVLPSSSTASTNAAEPVPMAAVTLLTEKPQAAGAAPETSAVSPPPATSTVIINTPKVPAVPVAAPPQAPAAVAALPASAAKPAASAAARPAAAPAAVPAAAASAPASGLLVFKARERAWIRVSDAKGAVQFEKTLAPGESAAASGTLPLSVVVGNVAGTEVLLRGQPFSLEGVSQTNVARFEVK